MVSKIVLLAVVVFTVLSSASGCFTDSGCYGDNVCCSGLCQDQYESCWCNIDSDCPGFGNQYCCDGICSYDYNCGYLDSGAIAGIIVGTIFFIIMVVFIGLCVRGFCCAAGPFRHRARNTRGRTYGTTTTVVSTTAATNPSYPQYPQPNMGQPGQYPPQYQQQPGYYQGPPQYSQVPGSGYQSMPAYQPAPPPYVGAQNQDNLRKGDQYDAPPAVNPNI